MSASGRLPIRIARQLPSPRRWNWLNFYVEYALECIASGVWALPPDVFQALIIAIVTE